MEFPRLVYRAANVHFLVEDVKAFDAAIAADWYASVPEALKKEHLHAKPVVDNSPPTRAELEAQAAKLEIKFDGRTSDKKLEALITEKLGHVDKA